MRIMAKGNMLRKRIRRFLMDTGRNTKPNIPTASTQVGFSECTTAALDAVVVTDTVIDDALVPLTFKLDGVTVHVAPVGAPLHVSEVCPAIPAPPIVSIYLAVPPAVTVSEPEPPDGMPNPNVPVPVPVPDSATI
jgi:hypothetical protein